VLCPLSLDVPAWGDEAEQIRSEASGRTAALIARLQEAGIPARGEVIDGSPADAVRIARTAHHVNAVLIASRQGDALPDGDEISAAAGEASVEYVSTDGQASTPSGGQASTPSGAPEGR